MILHPPLIALLVGALLASFLLRLASGTAVRVLRVWDLSSGSEAQLDRPR